MIKKIIPLTMGGLAIGTTEFVVMGLLPDIAKSLNVSIPQAGHFISAYALGVVIGAPLLVAFSSKFPPKKILIVLMLIFAIFNALSALMPDYNSFLAARFFSGLPHGAFFGVGAVVAKNLAPLNKQAQAISVMFAGLTLANLAMVPLVTFLGHEFSWRIAFGIVSVLGIATIVSIYAILPKIPPISEGNIFEDLKFFKTPVALYIIAIVAIGFGGLFAWFSYITPLMTEVSKFEPSKIPSIMILAGFGMLIGNFLGGWMADKMRPALASAILFGIFVVVLILVFSFSENKMASLALTFVCGILSMSVGSPINIIMIRAAKKSEMLAAAFMQAAFNIANSVGAYLGGIPLIKGYGYQYPSLVGAFLAFGGLLLCVVFMLKFKPFTQKVENEDVL